MATLINEQFSILSPKTSKPILADIRFVEGTEAMPIIIFCHGFKGFKDWGHFNHIANEFASRGFVFVKFNFSHNGTTIDFPREFKDLEAFGNNNISKELDDLGDIINAIAEGSSSVPEAPIDKSKIFLTGHSRGGAVTILKAREDKRITAAAAWAPVNDFRKRYSDEILKQWKKDGVYNIQNSRTGQDMPLYYQYVEDIYNNERTNVPDALKDINCPLLAIHGTADETLDYIGTKTMKDINPGIEVKLIEDGTHTFGGSHPWTSKSLPQPTQEVIDVTDNFFRQMF